MAPVIDAQRVPPSACSTSQSIVTCRSPSAAVSVTARRLRPMSRWISCVRPDCLPAAASRAPRVCVARGNMPYSAVTQPLPLPFRNAGTRSSTLAVHSTCVCPTWISTEPSACRVKPRWMRTGRSSWPARSNDRAMLARHLANRALDLGDGALDVFLGHVVHRHRHVDLLCGVARGGELLVVEPSRVGYVPVLALPRHGDQRQVVRLPRRAPVRLRKQAGKEVD